MNIKRFFAGTVGFVLVAHIAGCGSTETMQDTGPVLDSGPGFDGGPDFDGGPAPLDAGMDGATMDGATPGSDAGPPPPMACEATGFANAANAHALPSGDYPTPQDAVHCDFRGHYRDDTFFLTDLDGDELLDLVVTDECGTTSAVGSEHWLVYRNDGENFATTPTQFALPAGNFPVPQDTVHCSFRGHYRDDTYFLADLDADGRVDLVVTDECDGASPVGTEHWLVYRNEGTRFAAAAMEFALPAGNYPVPQDTVHCSFTGHYRDDTYFLEDLDGDERLDLVVTDQCALENAVGTEYWLVYRNEGTRFAAAATEFALPAGNYPVPRDVVHCDYRGHYRDDTYTLRDLDGDGLVDLVVTDECGAANNVGSEHWALYRNDGEGFASMSTRFSLPAGNYPVPQDQVHYDFIGHYRDDTYALVDVDGDARPDLVVTDQCGMSNGVGSDHWLMFHNEEAGFASAATQLTLPASAHPVPQDFVHCDFRGHYRDDTYAWTDVDGDARPDLVVTQRCGGAGATGRAHWEVFSLECAD